MRVGANARQYHQIKRLHAQGTPANVIAAKFIMTPQSLEKILAHLDGRDERILAVDDNPEVNKMRLENAQLLQRLAKYENPEGITDGEEPGPGETAQAEGSGQEEGSEEIPEEHG